MKYAEFTQKLGLDDKEAKIYQALIENGPMLPQHIAEKTGIGRTTLYVYFPKMLERGYLEEVTKGRRRFLQAGSPELLAKKHKRESVELESLAREMEIYSKLSGLKPKVELFEGIDGLKQLHFDMLESKSLVKAYLQVSNYNEEMMRWLRGKFVDVRVQKKVSIRAIVPSESESERILPGIQEELRETRLVPWEKFPFRIQTMIYDDKISYATYEKDGPLAGIIIESKQIAESQSAVFDLAWEGAERFAE